MSSFLAILKLIPPAGWLAIIGLFTGASIAGTAVYKNGEFEKRDAAKVQEINTLKAERDNYLKLMKEAEAKEQIAKQQADQLRDLIDKAGGKIEKDQQKIEEANKKYTEDLNYIKDAGEGKITLFDLCSKQCQDSAKVGFPCRVNYCNMFK